MPGRVLVSRMKGCPSASIMAIKFVFKSLSLQAVSKTSTLHNRATWRTFPSHKQGDAYQSFVANDRNFGRSPTFHHIQQGHNRIGREIHMLRLRGSGPLQQSAMRHKYACQGTQYRIAHTPGLIWQKRQRQHGLSKGGAPFCPQRAEMLTQQNIVALRQNRKYWGNKERDCHTGQHQQDPEERSGMWQQPAKKQCTHSSRGD